MPARAYTDAEIDAAVQALSDPARLEEAQQTVARVAPQLQGVLSAALAHGGWFGSAHAAQVHAAAGDPEAVGNLVAEETRLSMLVGVAVGFELAHELRRAEPDEDAR